MPYISATIIIQLLTARSVPFEQAGAAKKVAGQKLFGIRTLSHRAVVHWPKGIYFAGNWLNPQKAVFKVFKGGQLVLSENHFLYYFVTVTVMTAGTMLVMWLGEQITERGIGNGVSLVITIGILARLPNAMPKLD